MQELRVKHLLSLSASGQMTIFAGTVLINLLALAIPLAMLQLFQRIIPNQSTHSLQVLFTLLCAVVALDTALKIARNTLSASTGRKTETEVTNQVIDRIFHGPQAQLDEIGSERLTEQVLSIPKLQNKWNGQRLVHVVDLFFACVFLAFVWVLAGALILVPIAMICTVLILARRARSKHLNAIREIEQNDGQRMSFLIEVLQNIRLLKIFGAEQRILRKYESLHKRAAFANSVLVRTADMKFTTLAIMGQATTGVTSLVGAWMVIGNQLGLAELATSILLTGRAAQPVIAWAFSLPEVENEKRMADDLNAILELPHDSTPILREDIAPLAIQCREVTAHVPSCAPISLGSIDIPRNQITVIRGQRGAPAGPVLQMLAGKSSPVEGIVAIDEGGDTNSLPCVHIPADPDMLGGTLLHNLSDFRGQRHIPQRLSWAYKLGLSREISSIPGGLGANFSDGGKGVGSLGFYKKLSLARGFGREMPILLLEDPFAALDPSAAQRLRDVILELSGEVTIILSDDGGAFEQQAGTIITLHPDKTAQITQARDDAAPELREATQ